MALSLKLLALGLICYLAGLIIFQPQDRFENNIAQSQRHLELHQSSRSNPLRFSGAVQVEETLAYVERLDSSEAIQSFAAQLNANPDQRNSETLWSILLARWSQLDPEGMLAFLEAEKISGRPTHMEGLAWQAWGASDPRAAVSQVDGIDKLLSEQLFKGIAMVDPDLAVELAFKAPDADQLLNTVFQNGADFSSETIAYISQFTGIGWIGGEARKLLAKQAHTGDPATDRETAHKLSGDSYSEMDLFIEKLSREKPAEAAALLDGDPSSRLRAASAVNVARNWALKDPDASLAWVRQQSSPQVKNSSLVAIASAIGGEDPLRGLALIEEIGWVGTESLLQRKIVTDGKVSKSPTVFPNSHKTLTVAKSLLQNLAASDPAAARQYLEENVPVRYRADLEIAINE